MDISVIIVNYNTRKTTQECIDSVFKQTTGIEFEIILIDNASTDDSKFYFEADKRITYVYSYENMGFGRANNVGMMLANGNFIFLLNSDTLLVNNAIKEFFDYAKSQGKNDIYGCWLEDLNGDPIHSYNGENSCINELFRVFKWMRGKKNKSDENRNSILSVSHITGADLFFSSNIYHQTRGFDHNFFMYFEETDLQDRARLFGTQCILLPMPRIIHLEGGSQYKSRLPSLKKSKMWNKSMFYYYRKHSSFVSYFIFRILYIFIHGPITLLRYWNHHPFAQFYTLIKP